jgi:serine/threonine-protein kinase
LLGTVAYMAPEQARGAKIDARTDIYALGVVAYQALTGVVPFTGNNPFMVLARHVNEMPRPPRELVATIPAAAEEIVLRCMAKAPEDRYQSMDELAVAIGSVPVLEVPAMGEAAPVIATGRTPVWSAPPHLDLPRGEPVQRVAATEKLGSGSGHVLAGTTEESPAQLSWAPAPAPARAPSRPQAQTERQPPPQHPAATPYKAFFVLGFGLGIVAACAVAVFAIMQFDREREDVASDTPTPVVVPPAEPAPVDPPPEPEPVEPEPVEPEPVEPEPVEPEPVEPAPVEAPPSEHVAAAEDADVAAPPSKPDPRPRTKRRRRPTGPTNADAPADTPRDRPRETKREPDLHPDLRPAYQ